MAEEPEAWDANDRDSGMVRLNTSDKVGKAVEVAGFYLPA